MVTPQYPYLGKPSLASKLYINASHKKTNLGVAKVYTFPTEKRSPLECPGYCRLKMYYFQRIMLPSLCPGKSELFLFHGVVAEQLNNQWKKQQICFLRKALVFYCPVEE